MSPVGCLASPRYGGQVNAVASDATASAQRDSILTTSCAAGWGNPNDESRTLAWVRAFYRDLFADTGGVPVPGEICDGAMINHPDVDLADPEWNTSGVPWHALLQEQLRGASAGQEALGSAQRFPSRAVHSPVTGPIQMPWGLPTAPCLFIEPGRCTRSSRERRIRSRDHRLGMVGHDKGQDVETLSGEGTGGRRECREVVGRCSSISAMGGTEGRPRPGGAQNVTQSRRDFETGPTSIRERRIRNSPGERRHLQPRGNGPC